MRLCIGDVDAVSGPGQEERGKRVRKRVFKEFGSHGYGGWQVQNPYSGLRGWRPRRAEDVYVQFECHGHLLENSLLFGGGQSWVY